MLRFEHICSRECAAECSMGLSRKSLVSGLIQGVANRAKASQKNSNCGDGNLGTLPEALGSYGSS